MASYYSQRSSGGLIVTEATFIAEEAAGYPSAPGIYNAQQVDQWRDIVRGVHEKSSVVYCQLWALGRANVGGEPGVKTVSSSTIPLKEASNGDALQMGLEDIKRYMQHYRQAAKNAIDAGNFNLRIGFDGVEVHGAHGYLVDQFLQSSSNSTRNDEYGGSLENRARFLLEAMQNVVDVVGEERAAIRISPFSPFQDMGQESDPFETWGYVCQQLKTRFPKLAYISVTDPRLGADGAGDDMSKVYSVDKLRAVFRGVDPSTISKLHSESTTVFSDPTPEHPTVFLSAGGYTASEAEPSSERTGDLIGIVLSNSRIRTSLYCKSRLAKTVAIWTGIESIRSIYFLHSRSCWFD